MNDKPGSDKDVKDREADAAAREDDGWPELEVADVLAESSDRQQWDDVTVKGFPTMELPGLLQEGSRFGSYIVGPLIGEGGMARIYRAEHEGLQRQVALKVLLDNLGREAQGQERFLREARIAAAIKHPNVVNIFDVGIHQGRPYFVMELLEGKDLAAFVESDGPLPEPVLMDVIIPIVAGLAAVHDAGIVHRDLKPGNIFLARGRNDEIEPKLLDFGISKSSAPDQMRLTHSKSMMVGTPFYMSPEASRGQEMTALSDQYALGVVLYEAATGTNPFAGATTVAEVVRQVTTGDYPAVTTRNARLSKRMVAIIERAMHLDPARRFPDMRAMGRELLQLAGQRTRITWGLSFSELAPSPLTRLPTATGPISLPDPAWAQPTRGSKRRTLGWAGLAAAAGVAVWLLWPAREPRGVSVVARNDSPSEQTLRLVPQPGASSSSAIEPNAPGSSPAPTEEAVAAGDSPADEAGHDPSGATRSGDSSEREARSEPAARTPARARAPARRGQDRPQRARPRRTAQAVARRIEPAAAPDWMVSADVQETAASDSAERGTNNAPILD